MELDRWAYFDVDDTLVEWVNQNDERVSKGGWVSIVPEADYVFFPCIGNVEKLKKLKGDGWTIVVWSQGGWKWAEEVLTALSLRTFVDHVLTKPHLVVDDLESSFWLPAVVHYSN